MAITRDNRQILVNPHSPQDKVPVGVLNLGEIGVQHTGVEDAALYVETVADSQSASTVAKFITEKAIDARIEDAIDIVQNEIDGINEAVGLPHDPEQWNSGLSVWQAIEQTYEEMTAGTAAASTKLFIDETGGHEEKYLELRSVVDQASSAVNYYIKSEGIDERVESAYTLVSEKVEALSAATQDVLGALDFTGVTQEGKPIVNITQEDGLVDAEAGEIDAHYVTVGTGATPLDEVIDDILDVIDANEVESSDGSIIVDASGAKTDLRVNIDDASIVLNDNNELVADLKLSAITPSGVNVKEEYALFNHNGVQLGDSVKIYKDSSLYGAQLGTMGDELAGPDDPTIVEGSGDTALDLIYHKEDGTYELVKIDVNDFLEESEFKDGLVVDNHVVKVLVDPESEEVVIGDSGETAPVLSVSEDGVKVDNIQAAINYAVSKQAGMIDADVTGASQDGHVTVEVVQENTALAQVVVTTDDIASAEELDTVEASVGLEDDGSFVPDPDSYYASAATSVRDEIHLLDEALKEVSDKLDSASVTEGASTDNYVALSVTDDGEGATAITIDDSELKQTIDFIIDDIAQEIADRKEAINDLRDELIGDSASTSADTTIMGVREYVSELVEMLDANAVQGVEFGQVSEKDYTDEGSGAGAEVVDGDNGKKIVLDLSTLKIDCGEYE